MATSEVSSMSILPHPPGLSVQLQWQLLSRGIHHSSLVYKRLKQPNHGFTLIEVLVAMLVAVVFVSMTMQALVASAVFRVAATQYDEAVSWIQEDLESVIRQASQYEMTALPYSSRCNATNSGNGLAAGFINDTPGGLGGSSATIGPRALGGKYYTMTRTATYTDSSDPFKLLYVTYTVIPQGQNQPIANVRTEVIPHAVFKCL